MTYPAEEIESFRHILKLPDPRETMPRFSTTILGLDDEKRKHELRQRGLSAMLPLSPYPKDVLPEGKYIKPPASTTKWYKVGQDAEAKLRFCQDLYISKTSGAPMGKVRLHVLKEVERQARQNHQLCSYLC